MTVVDLKVWIGQQGIGSHELLLLKGFMRICTPCKWERLERKNGGGREKRIMQKMGVLLHRITKWPSVTLHVRTTGESFSFRYLLNDAHVFFVLMLYVCKVMMYVRLVFKQLGSVCDSLQKTTFGRRVHIKILKANKFHLCLTQQPVANVNMIPNCEAGTWLHSISAIKIPCTKYALNL